jgi:putative PIN family toxin of toxin-antitoxin system
MKIILDTNVIVSALLSPSGLPARILNSVLNGGITIVYDNGILEEYADVLSRKKLKINKELVEQVMDFFSSEGEFKIASPQKIRFSDEDDKKFYELYKSGGIDYLVTGNIRHFPDEKGIVTVRKFIQVFENSINDYINR